MKRREFITLVGGATAWPFIANGQQPDPLRRVALILSVPADDRPGRAQAEALREGLQELGWTEGRNIQIDLHGIAEPGQALGIAKDVVANRPEVICSLASPGTVAVVQVTKTIPIVFGNVADPVALGLVTSYARPGGNVTGFSAFESSIGGKWVEILRDFDTRIRRITILFNPNTAPARGKYFLPSFKTAGKALGLETVEAQVYDAAGIEQAIEVLSSEASGGLVVMPDAFTGLNRDLIIQLAAKRQLPLIAGYRSFSDFGGLVSYGPSIINLAYRTASYVDRILRGEKPAELPIQAPTKFEMVINLGTAKALGLAVPPTLLAQANDVIE
jgi:putative ABC transport system substrate-binding protein